MDREGILLILIYLFGYSSQFRYEFMLEDENIFSPCEDGPPGSLNIDHLFDLSHMTFTMTEKGVHVEGNITVVWNIQPTDFISAELSLSHFDRGSWVPTILNLSPKDLCSILFDEKQFWYSFWFKPIRNSQDVKDKCIRVPGTIWQFDPYYLNAIFGFDVPLRAGRYKINLIIFATDFNGVKRNNTICSQIRGDISKL